MCCDICQLKCKCDGDSCSFKFFDLYCETSDNTEKENANRCITTNQRDSLKLKLEYLAKAHRFQFMKRIEKGNIPCLTPVDLLCGFGNTQITQIIDNCNKLFTIGDIYKFVDIWDPSIANEVLMILGHVFGDIDVKKLENEESEEEENQGGMYLLDTEIFNFNAEESVLVDIPSDILDELEDFDLDSDDDL